MNERIVHNVLTAGLAPFIADPDRLETYFQQEHGISAAETALLRTYFTRDPAAGEIGGPPNLIYGYPRSSGPWPCWAIILMNDRSQQRTLGDDAGTMDDFADEEDLDGEAAIPLVRISANTLSIDTYVPQLSDVCLYYYTLLRHIVFQAVGTLQKAPNHLQNVEFSGADLMPNPQYLPEDIWVRRLTLTFITEEAAWEAKSEPTGVGGAHVNNEITGVTGAVEPYTE